jgi:hypothetical protein
MTDGPEQEELKTPLSFKVMVVLVVLYLGWRLVQIVVWIWERIF